LDPRTRTDRSDVRVAVIVLNWNGLADTRRCLQSLRTQRYAAVVPIVVDNGSSDPDEARILEDEFLEAHVVRLSRNAGFGKGVAAGAETARRLGADHLMLLNNDARIDAENDTIRKLVAALASNATLGAVAPVILEDDSPHDIQSAGHDFSLWTGYPKRLMANEPRDAVLKTLSPSFIVGACLLMRLADFDRLGGFDSDFFVYSEDFDLGLRMRAQGLRQVLVPDAFVYHKKAAATTMWSGRHCYLMMRSHLILVAKHARWFHWFTLLPGLLVISAGMVVHGVRNGRRDAAGGVVRGWRDFVLGRWGDPDEISES
jgi:GT2 family glycosyltransferase